MRPPNRVAQNVLHRNLMGGQGIRNHCPVAPPGDGLGAHYSDLLFFGQLDQPQQVFFENRGLHIIRVPPEGCIAPTGIPRIFLGPAQTSEFGHVRVPDVHCFQGSGQSAGIELGIAARTRDRPDIDHPLHPMRLETARERF